MIETKTITTLDQADITMDCAVMLHIAKRLMEENDTHSDLFHLGAEINGRIRGILRIINPKYLNEN